jgi:hypothetical protein
LIAFLQECDRPILPLYEYQKHEGPAIGLRHDVDRDPDAALYMATYEKERGIRATYFIKHTSAYYRIGMGLTTAALIQDMGHEIGFHNDLLTVLYEEPKTDIRRLLNKETNKFLYAGIHMRGTSAHGSYAAREHRFLNWYVWDDAEMEKTHPNYTSMPTKEGGRCEIPKLCRAEWFEYEANFIEKQRYYSDADMEFDMKELARRMTKCEFIQVSTHPNKRNTEGDYLWVSRLD